MVLTITCTYFCQTPLQLANRTLVGVGVDFVFPRKKEGKRRTLTLLLTEGMTLHVLTLVTVLWVSGGCLVGVWRVSERCLEGVLRVSGRCLEGVLRVSGWYICDIQMVI